MATFARRVCTLSLIGTMVLLIVTLLPATANAQRGKRTAFCKKLFNPNLNPLGKIFASQGAQIYCFGRQLNGFSIKGPAVPPSSKNVDAADPAEDISPNGTQAFGQSETSIAAV